MRVMHCFHVHPGVGAVHSAGLNSPARRAVAWHRPADSSLLLLLSSPTHGVPVCSMMTASLPRHTNQTGVPIMRPLWFEFPDSSDLFAVDDEFMLGPGMLIKPVTHVSTDEVTLLWRGWQVGGVNTA